MKATWFCTASLGEGCRLFAVLLLVCQWSAEAAGITDQKTSAVGSSVLLIAPDSIKDVNYIQWEYIHGSSTHFIVQYYKDSSAPTIYEHFAGRVDFISSNGSLLLKELQEADSGIYKATVNLIESDARKTILTVIKPLSEPQVWCNSSLAGFPIKIVCDVQEGKVDMFSWEKEGGPLPPERCYQLSKNRSVLHIMKGEKSDCGSYSCNVSNEISWNETSLNLTIIGVSSSLEHAQTMSGVALVFALVAVLGFTMLLCQSAKRRIKGETWRWLFVFIHGLVCLSCVLLFVAMVIWMHNEGPSPAFILLELFLLYAIIITILVMGTLALKPAKLSGFKTKIWHRVILDSAAPGAMIAVVLFACLLLQKIHQLHERGCSQPADLTGSTVISAVTALLGLLFLFIWYHKTQVPKREAECPAREQVQELRERTQEQHCPTSTFQYKSLGFQQKSTTSFLILCPGCQKKQRAVETKQL
ncbi:hypothetical protein Y1Q_0007340 [Alligator mississippiensis]|uniref:Ig-like domain-containing protein n=1 Tax=Alligator mississippiensis TaxID=8496 RepID=A0A151P804_ALLMI|nr:hypothetical protein Y1Q_0007340 [Alligator mississippiensis]